MASISVGGGHGGKKPLDHEIPLIPFIDLLLCCVMFLLVTAVWNQLAAVQANLRTPAHESEMIEPPRDIPPLMVHVGESAFTIASDVGDRTEIAFANGVPDLAALEEQLTQRHAISPDSQLIVVADDGIPYEAVIAAMDTVTRAGFERVTMGDSGL